jgi:hypothetical protein
MRTEASTSETSQWQSAVGEEDSSARGNLAAIEKELAETFVLRRTCSGHEESCTEEGSPEEGARQEGSPRQEGSCEEEVGRLGLTPVSRLTAARRSAC